MNLLEIHNMKKTFGDLEVLKDISLSVIPYIIQRNLQKCNAFFEAFLKVCSFFLSPQAAFLTKQASEPTRG